MARRNLHEGPQSILSSTTHQAHALSRLALCNDCDLHVYVPDLGEERSGVRVSLAVLTLGVGDAQPAFFHALENGQPVKERQTFALVALFEC